MKWLTNFFGFVTANFAVLVEITSYMAGKKGQAKTVNLTARRFCISQQCFGFFRLDSADR